MPVLKRLAALSKAISPSCMKVNDDFPETVRWMALCVRATHFVGRNVTRAQKDVVLKELESAPKPALFRAGKGYLLALSAGTAMDIRAQLLCESTRHEEALELVTQLEEAVERDLLPQGYPKLLAGRLLMDCTHSYNVMSELTTHMREKALADRIRVCKRVMELLDWETHESDIHLAKEARVDLCYSLLHSKRYREILPTLRESIKLMPDQISSLSLLLSTALICLRRLPEAEDAIRRGLALAERMEQHIRVEYLTNLLAELLNLMGRGDEALHVLDSCRQPDGEVVWTQHSLLLKADVLQSLGKLEEAVDVEEMLAAAAEESGEDLQLDKCPPVLHRRALLALREGRKKDAAALLRKWRLELDEQSVTFFRTHDTKPREKVIGPRELLIELLEEEGGNDEEIRLLSEEVQAIKDNEDKLRQEALEEVRLERRRHAASADGGEGGRRRRQKKKGKKGKGTKRSKSRAQLKDGVSAAQASPSSTTAAAAGGSGAGGVSQQQQRHHHHHQQQQQEKAEQEKAPMPSHQAAAVDVTEGRDVEDQECSICFLELQGDDTEGEEGGGCLLRDCGHCFHYQCLDLWAEKCQTKGIEPTCPLCRAPLRRDDHV